MKERIRVLLLALLLFLGSLNPLKEKRHGERELHMASLTVSYFKDKVKIYLVVFM